MLELTACVELVFDGFASLFKSGSDLASQPMKNLDLQTLRKGDIKCIIIQSTGIVHKSFCFRSLLEDG